VVVAVGVILLVVRIAHFVVSLALLAGRIAVIAHGGVTLRLRRIMVRLHPILLRALVVPRGIIVAADHHLRHRGRCDEQCSQAKGKELPHHRLLVNVSLDGQRPMPAAGG